LTPSSYGLQPWKFLVITDRNVREALVQHSWGQKQPAQCSHFVVITIPRAIDEAWIDRYLERQAEVRGSELGSLAGFRNMMVAGVVHGMNEVQQRAWAKDQAYIALGNFMTCAALLGVDTCPMEGLVPEKYDEVLGLSGNGFQTAVACAAGYRDESDKYARELKVRFSVSDVVQRI
jgi:nitroreductase